MAEEGAVLVALGEGEGCAEDMAVQLEPSHRPCESVGSMPLAIDAAAMFTGGITLDWFVDMPVVNELVLFALFEERLMYLYVSVAHASLLMPHSESPSLHCHCSSSASGKLESASGPIFGKGKIDCDER